VTRADESHSTTHEAGGGTSPQVLATQVTGGTQLVHSIKCQERFGCSPFGRRDLAGRRWEGKTWGWLRRSGGTNPNFFLWRIYALVNYLPRP